MGRINKVIVAGAKSVGKTSFLESVIFSNSIPEKEYVPTIEDIYVCSVETDKGSKEKLRFYDTAGFEPASPKALSSHYHSLADAYMLVYSVKDMISLQTVIGLKKDIDRNKKDSVVIVVGCHSDGRLSSVREAGERWASVERIRHWDVNVVNRNTLLEPLMELASKLSPQPSKTSLPQFYMPGRKYKE